MTTAMKYTVVTHPRSGERFAAEINNGVITRLAGPCRVIDGQNCDPLTDAPLTEDMIREWLDNAGESAVADAIWYRAKLKINRL